MIHLYIAVIEYRNKTTEQYRTFTLTLGTDAADVRREAWQGWLRDDPMGMPSRIRRTYKHIRFVIYKVPAVEEYSTPVTNNQTPAQIVRRVKKLVREASK